LFLPVLLALLAFGFVTTPAARAEVRAGIEIGGRGVKVIVLDVTSSDAGNEVTVKMVTTKDTNLVAGLAKTGVFDPGAVKDTTTAIKSFLDTIGREHKLRPDQVPVVGSSGLLAPVAYKPEQVKKCQADLAREVSEATGAKMTFITPRQEVELSLKACIPQRFRATAVFLDIGGGNTKGGYFDAEGKPVRVSLPYGTASFTQLVKKSGGSFADELAKQKAATLVPAVNKAFAPAPELRKRPRVVLCGGVVWAVSTLTRPGETAPFTPFVLEDVQAVEKKLLAQRDKLPVPELTELPAEKRKRAEAELKRVKKSFDSREGVFRRGGGGPIDHPVVLEQQPREGLGGLTGHRLGSRPRPAVGGGAAVRDEDGQLRPTVGHELAQRPREYRSWVPKQRQFIAHRAELVVEEGDLPVRLLRVLLDLSDLRAQRTDLGVVVGELRADLGDLFFYIGQTCLVIVNALAVPQQYSPDDHQRDDQGSPRSES
jgi:hypothetical protein